LARDGESEAGAAEVARGRSVDLAERLKQQVKLSLGYADSGVAHFEAQERLFLIFAEFVDLDGDFTALGELNRIADQIQEHLAQASGVAAQTLRHLGIDRQGQGEALGPGRFEKEVDRSFDRRGKLEVDLLESYLAGRQLGEIQNFVNKRQQRFAALAHVMSELALFRTEAGVEQQTGHPDNRVERSADLVAHVGEEFRFGPGGFDRGVARRGQRGFVTFAVGDVVRDY
jgi:hypothetical protein